jgi:hypothetical protein
MVSALAFLSLPLSFFGVSYELADLLRPLFRWSDYHLVSGWWILLELPFWMLLFAVPLSVAVGGMVLLRNWAARSPRDDRAIRNSTVTNGHWNPRSQESHAPFQERNTSPDRVWDSDPVAFVRTGR